MGIDIYLEWDGQTKAEHDKQITGFSVVSGNVGYLREAYHGGPYATRYLVSEAFRADEGGAYISAETLRKRLPEALRLHVQRDEEVYHLKCGPGEKCYEAFVEFVKLAEQKQKEGKKIKVVASY